MSQARDVLLTLNAGSSSIKFALFAFEQGHIERQALFHGQIENIGTAQPRLMIRDAHNRLTSERTLDDAPADSAGQHRHALDCLLGWLDAQDQAFHLQAIGHRVVHGGERYSRPLLITPHILQALATYNPLAPLHQPHNLAAIATTTALMPELPQVACFDTAFHASQPALARRYALPRHLHEAGIQRYGFHGLSYEFIATTLTEHLPEKTAQGRVIVAHLGNGASMCAMQNRQSVATTMGFTALDGLMMGTRAGSLDPGVLIYLMDNYAMDSRALTHLLYKESGLLGVSGLSQDMRTLLAASEPAAHEAVELFCYRIVREIGSLAAALGGLDALVFTGGIGEHAAPVRAKVCARLGWLGITLDEAANAQSHGGIITAPASPCPVAVIPTNEEWMIAQHTASHLATRH